MAYWWPNWRLNCSKLLMPFGQISREQKIYFTKGGNQRVHWGLPEAFLLQVLNIIGCEKANRKVWFSDQTWIDRRDRSTWSDCGECHSRSTNMRSWHGLGRYGHFATKRNLGNVQFFLENKNTFSYVMCIFLTPFARGWSHTLILFILIKGQSKFA